jgi:hypothetical protein
MITNNQSTPGAIIDPATIIATYWPYVGTTTACALNKAAVVDNISGGAYNPAGTARATLGATPAYTAGGGSSDPQANVTYPANASIAAQRQSIVGVLTESKGVLTSQVSGGEQGRFVVNGRVVVTVGGFNDDASTGAAAKIGTFLTLDGNASRLGGFRVAASGEIVKARIVATTAGVATGTADVVAASATGTAIVELMGDSLAKL